MPMRGIEERKQPKPSSLRLRSAAARSESTGVRRGEEARPHGLVEFGSPVASRALRRDRARLRPARHRSCAAVCVEDVVGEAPAALESAAPPFSALRRAVLRGRRMSARSSQPGARAVPLMGKLLCGYAQYPGGNRRCGRLEQQNWNRFLHNTPCGLIWNDSGRSRTSWCRTSKMPLEPHEKSEYQITYSVRNVIYTSNSDDKQEGSDVICITLLIDIEKKSDGSTFYAVPAWLGHYFGLRRRCRRSRDI